MVNLLPEDIKKITVKNSGEKQEILIKIQLKTVV